MIRTEGRTMRTSGTSALTPDGRYTAADYKSWTDDVRRELIDGIVYEMSPAPCVAHQDLALELARRLMNFLDDKPCIPFMAPVDVYLLDEEDEEARNVVQPDVIVVCDQSKIREDGVYGAPDFVAKSFPDTAHKDLARSATYEKSDREYGFSTPTRLGPGLAPTESASAGYRVPEGSEVPAAALRASSGSRAGSEYARPRTSPRPKSASTSRPAAVSGESSE
jgi:hypothetical protein